MTIRICTAFRRRLPHPPPPPLSEDWSPLDYRIENMRLYQIYCFKVLKSCNREKTLKNPMISVPIVFCAMHHFFVVTVDNLQMLIHITEDQEKKIIISLLTFHLIWTTD